jgi:hypothetical protein
LIVWASHYRTNAGSVALLDNNGYKYLNNNSPARQAFMNDFLLPPAGYRYHFDALWTQQGSYGSYWSSSPKDTNAHPLYFYHIYYPNRDNADVVTLAMPESPSAGLSVRCFKNSISSASADPSIISIMYDPALPHLTSTGVTVTVTLDQNGSPLSGWTVNGTVFTKVFTGNWSGNITFTSTLGGTVSTGISVQNIDTTAPTILLNGS